MPKKVAVSTLNASTMEILNVIRQNASQEYQDQVPAVNSEHDIPKVGEVLYGYPALANQFISALVNRIASVRVKSATFNNPYRDLKKGFLQFGETVEEVFVQISKARVFSYEKAPARELKRSMPDVRTALHCMSWNVQYPVTVTETDLQKAFLSMDGVQDLISRIVDAVYKGAEYDEYLLFKYLIIKGVSAGKLYPVSVGDGTDPKEAAVAFRANSNGLTFMSDKYNDSHVHTVTPKDDQVIFMSAKYNADFDVNVLASAFNMDRADFMGRLYLIDDFTTFDNERFADIRSESDMIEEVTSAELALMEDVVAVLADKEWFQVYDNVAKFTEKFVASGDYWNYFYRIQKTISTSPFSNAIVFVTDSATISDPESLTAKVSNKSIEGTYTVLTITMDEKDTLQPISANFLQTEEATEAGIAVHPYGAIIYPTDESTMTPKIQLPSGQTYTATAAVTPATEAKATITFNKDA